MKGLFIPEITAKMFRNGSLESIETLMAEGEIYDIDYQQPCEDCISREAVIRLVEQYPGIITNRYSGLIVDIKHLPPVTPWSSWTPAMQLPPAHEAVLLYVKYKSSGQWTYQLGYWEDALEKWEKWLEIGTLEEEFDVIAWMELPEKYEEGEDE